MSTYFNRCAAGIWLALLAALPLGAAPRPDAQPVITGVVTGPDGVPAAGAEVVARNYTRNGVYLEDRRLVRTRADAHGAFRFAGLAPETGDFTILITAFAPGATAETGAASQKQTRVRLQLEREAAVPVRVVDTEGAPVPGVRLRVESAMIRYRPPLRSSRPVVRDYDAVLNDLLVPPTDAQGRVILSHVPHGAELKVLVEDRNWTLAGDTWEPAIILPRGGVNLPVPAVRVSRAARVSGRLVTEAGEGVAGWRVSIQGSIRPREVVTSADGEFAFAGLRAGPYTVRMSEPPNLRYARPDDLSITLQTGEERRGLRVVCPAGGVARLRVVRAEDGAPVPHCRVSLTSPGNDVSDGGGETDADGLFEQRQRPGTWHIQLEMPEGSARSYEFEPADAYAPLTRPWTARNGEVHDLGTLRVHLHPLSVIRGRIYRPDGTPAAGATVYYPLENETRRTLEWMPHVTTRADGSYETPPLDPERDQRHDIYAVLGDRWTVGPFLLGVVPGSDAGVDLQLTETPLAILRGSVVDDRGAPVPHAVLSVGDGTGLDGNATRPMPRTGADGRFVLHLWPEVAYTVFAGAEKHDWAQSSQFKLVPGRNGELAPLVLRRATSQLQFRVVDENGHPRPRIYISITREDPRSAVPPFMYSGNEATNERGAFELKNVLPGTYQVQLSDLMHQITATVAAGQPATLVLRRH